MGEEGGWSAALCAALIGLATEGLRGVARTRSHPHPAARPIPARPGFPAGPAGLPRRPPPGAPVRSPARVAAAAGGPLLSGAPEPGLTFNPPLFGQRSIFFTMEKRH